MADIMNTTRRMVLKSLPFAGAAVALPVAAAAVAQPIRAATREDLTRYYAFLWLEFSNLSKEMCVSMHDALVAHENGDIGALTDHLSAPPSTRANSVMKTIGADRDALVSTPMLPSKKCMQSPEERARYHYAEFVKVMNEATPAASGWIINGGSRRRWRQDAGGVWANVKTIHYDEGADPRHPDLVVERHEDFGGRFA